MPNHTPGQWEEIVETFTPASGRRQVRRYIVANDGTYVATIETESDHPRHGYKAPGESAPANARLIVRAPEMVETLRRFLLYNDKSTVYHQAASDAERILRELEAL